MEGKDIWNMHTQFNCKPCQQIESLICSRNWHRSTITSTALRLLLRTACRKAERLTSLHVACPQHISKLKLPALLTKSCPLSKANVHHHKKNMLVHTHERIKGNGRKRYMEHSHSIQPQNMSINRIAHLFKKLTSFDNYCNCASVAAAVAAVESHQESRMVGQGACCLSSALVAGNHEIAANCFWEIGEALGCVFHVVVAVGCAIMNIGQYFKCYLE